MNLRPYQDKFVSNIAATLKHVRRVCGQLATGGGKTVVFSAISAKYTARSGKAVLILVHRKELLQQTRITLFNMYGITAELIVAGTRYIPPAKVYIGMVESVNRRVERLNNIGLVIIDESHIATFNKMHYHFPNQFILGFTATPLSSSKRFPMKLYYEDIVCGIDIPDLIKEGFLCQNITRAPKEVVDRKEIAIKNGEFDDSAMAAAFSKPKHVHNVVEAYKKWSLNTKTIVFNVNIAHSQEVAKAFQEEGFECRHLDGEDNAGKRTLTLKWFKETPNAILCNVGILTAGFDEPTIENVIVNKATMSMPLWLQMTGRGGRIIDEEFINKRQREYPYNLQIKNVFGIIDMGGNALTHGDWCDSRDWQKLFREPPEPGKGGIAPVKNCPKCDGIVSAGRKACNLPSEEGELCGYVWPEKEATPEEMLEDFVIITKNIDAPAIIKANRDKKEYFAFFRIGTILAAEAKKTIKTPLTDEIANFVLGKYFEQGKLWAKEISEQRLAMWDEQGLKPKKIIFSEWHQAKAKEHLFNELKKHFTEWYNPISASITE
jgi:superfamily II DNA or RNA helicase